MLKNNKTRILSSERGNIMYETIKDYKADPYTLRIADNGDFIMDVLDNQNRKAGYLKLPFEKNIKNLAVWYARDLCIDIITAIGVLSDLHNNLKKCRQC